MSGGVGMGGEGEGIRFFDCGLTASAQNDNQKREKPTMKQGFIAATKRASRSLGKLGMTLTGDSVFERRSS